jgi:hypothetical protein
MRKIGSIFALISIIGVFIWAFSYQINPTPEKIDQAGQLIAQAAIPWWVSVIQFLASLGIIGAILILIFLYLVAKGKIA